MPEEDEVVRRLRRVIDVIYELGVDDARAALEEMPVGDRSILSEDLVIVGNILLEIADVESSAP
ncbi:MAG TPA: hypothetical protein VK273_07835 [Gaiellaceae bacterium]|nr:hypothetical protein [Gaiellaceae bacterium]